MVLFKSCVNVIARLLCVRVCVCVCECRPSVTYITAVVVSIMAGFLGN
jgi:hypothetical protein